MALARTLLATVQRVCAELGFVQPSTVVGGSVQDKQMQALANEVGNELMREVDWPVLRWLATVNTVNLTPYYQITCPHTIIQAGIAISTGGTLSCDRVITNTEWDTANHWRFVGSVNDQEWATYQFGMLSPPVVGWIYRTVAADTIEVFPVPTTGHLPTFKLSFITDLWALTNDAIPVPATNLSNDAYTHVFDAQLFDLGLKWRFLRAKRLAYDEERDRYERVLAARKGQLSTPQTLSITRRPKTHFVDATNIPETGYGGV